MSNEHKALLQVLQHKKPDRTPIWFMRQAGRYLPEYRKIRAEVSGFLELCYTPKLACEVTLQPLRRFDLDAAILFSDILVVLDALGISVHFSPEEGPVIGKVTDTDIPELDEIFFHNHLSPVYETIELIKSNLPKSVALIGFSGAPWTLACYAVDGKGNHQFPETRTLAYKNPVVFQQLIHTLAESIIIYLKQQIASGVEVIQLFDSWSGITAADQFERWVIQPTKYIISKVKESYPATPIIGFPKGAGVMLERYIEATGVDAIGVDYTVPLDSMKRLQNSLIVQGNLDPLLLANNKEEAIIQTQKIKRSLDQSRLIFNLGHGIVPQTPIDHVQAVIEEVRR